jgi:putative restriction endonuclease
MAEISNEAEFFRFMEGNGPPSDGGKRNYLSWLRYVNEQYRPNLDALTRESIDEIVRELLSTQSTRNKYTSNSAISDIKSSLNKYLAFVIFKERISDVVTDINSVLGEIDTVAKTEIETRLGQGRYRSQLIDIWRKCSVTEFDRVDLLVASHIKPWWLSTGQERIDPFNGLLPSPNLDKLFDRGYISFENNGVILISEFLSESDLNKLGISKSMRLYKTEEHCIPYLNFHRKEVLL